MLEETFHKVVQMLVVITPVEEIPEDVTAEVPEADVIVDESLKTSNHANSHLQQQQQDLPDEEELRNAYPERTKDLLEEGKWKSKCA